MEFVALRYVRINNRLYSRGEIIEGEIPQEALGRLIQTGAVREAEPMRAQIRPPRPPQAAEAKQPEPAESAESAESAAEDETIDVMEGLVEEAPKPAKKRGKKT